MRIVSDEEIRRIIIAVSDNDGDGANRVEARKLADRAVNDTGLRFRRLYFRSEDGQRQAVVEYGETEEDERP